MFLICNLEEANEMKKRIFILIIFLVFLTNIVSATDNNNDEREWHEIFNRYFIIHALGPTSYPTDIEVLSWKEINATYKNSILFNLTFIPKYPIQGKYFENIEYFVEGQEITAIKCYIDKIDRNTVLSNVTLTILTPGGKFYRNISFLEENFTGTNIMKIKLFDGNPIIFNETGIWKLLLNFEAYTKNLIWKYVTGYGYDELYQTFKLTESISPELENITFYNEYREAIPVITLSQALEVSNTAYMAEQTMYLYETASSLNESSESIKQTALAAQREVSDSRTYYILMIIATIALVVANAFLAYFNSRLVVENRELRKQKELEDSAWGVRDKIVASKPEVYTAIRDIRDILDKRLPTDESKRRRK